MPNFMTFSRDRLVVLAECIRRKAQVQRPKSSVPSPASQVLHPKSSVPQFREAEGRLCWPHEWLVLPSLSRGRRRPPLSSIETPNKPYKPAFHADFYAAPGFRAEGRRRL